MADVGVVLECVVESVAVLFGGVGALSIVWMWINGETWGD